MLRDLTLIFSVLLSIVSVAFGAYKNIEAGNAQGFAYEQAYRIIGQIGQANISQAAKTQLTAHAIASIGAPPGVLDFFRSNAAVVQPTACTASQQAQCTETARLLGAANAACAKLGAGSPECQSAVTLGADVRDCVSCFTP